MPSPKVKNVTVTISFDVPLQADLGDVQSDIQYAVDQVYEMNGANPRARPEVQFKVSEPFTPLYLDTMKSHPSKFYEPTPEPPDEEEPIH